MTEGKHTAEPDLMPGLLRAIEIVKKFKDEYHLVHDTRKRFDLSAMQRVANQGLDFVIEDLEAEAGLRAPWDPEASRPLAPSKRSTTPHPARAAGGSGGAP